MSTPHVRCGTCYWWKQTETLGPCPVGTCSAPVPQVLEYLLETDDRTLISATRGEKCRCWRASAKLAARTKGG